MMGLGQFQGWQNLSPMLGTLGILVSIALFIFWVYMLIHAATKQEKDKLVWVVIICLTHIIGAIIYFFVMYRNTTKSVSTPDTSSL